MKRNQVAVTRNVLSMFGAAVLLAAAAQASVIDDAKFKLGLHGDPNANAYIDAGEVGCAFAGRDEVDR